MDLKAKILNTETEEVQTVEEIIEAIREIRGEEITTEYALNEIEYSIKHGILKEVV